MKKKSIIRYLLVGISLIVSLVIYLYLNPTIDNKDFDLEYKVSSGKKKYFEYRNNNYSDEEYKFNHQIYYNANENIKLIIHSLDKEQSGKEKVIFVIEKSKETPIGYLDYMSKNNKFGIFKIRYLRDSIFMQYKGDSIIFFKGKKLLYRDGK